MLFFMIHGHKNLQRRHDAMSTNYAVFNVPSVEPVSNPLLVWYTASTARTGTDLHYLSPRSYQ